MPTTRYRETEADRLLVIRMAGLEPDVESGEPPTIVEDAGSTTVLTCRFCGRLPGHGHGPKEASRHDRAHLRITADDRNLYVK